MEKFCVNCRHYLPDSYIDCMSNNNFTISDPDIITGKREHTKDRTRTLRSYHDHKCGPEGNWFEPFTQKEIERKIKEHEESEERSREYERQSIIEADTKKWGSFWKFYYIYLLPLLTLISVILFEGVKIGLPILMAAIPLLNWVLIYVTFDVLISRLLIFWVILGGVLCFITKPNKKIAAAAWEQGRERREQRAKNKAFVSAVVRNAFGFGWGGAILGVFVGFGKGCVRFDGSRPNPYGHPNLLEPFWYIPETALYYFIIGAIIGIIFRVIKGQK